MKTKQEMISRSVYMPKPYWVGVDEIAEKKDLSANQVIRRLVSSWLLGFVTINEEKEESARPAIVKSSAPLNTKIIRPKNARAKRIL